MPIVDISSGSINGVYITLNDNTDYKMTSNLTVDWITFHGFINSGSGTGITLYGNGYTLFVKNATESQGNIFNLNGLTTYDLTIYTISSNTIIPPNSVNSYLVNTSNYTSIGSADISGDGFIYLTSGTYSLTTNLVVVPTGEYISPTETTTMRGFKIVGSSLVSLLCNNNTLTTTNTAGIFTCSGGNGNVLVSALNVIADSNPTLDNGNGWIFHSTGFSQMKATYCTVTCGSLIKNSGGIFGGNNTGSIICEGCHVVVSGDITTGGLSYTLPGGAGGICGGNNSASVSCNYCTAVVSGNIVLDNGYSGGGGGICGGSNNSPVSFEHCTVSVAGDVANLASNTGGGGGGGICGGGNNTTVSANSCTVDIAGSVRNSTIANCVGGVGGGGGGICGGCNAQPVLIQASTVIIYGDVTNEQGSNGGGGGGICGGYNRAPITVSSCHVHVGGNLTNFVDPGEGKDERVSLSISFGGGGGGGICGGFKGRGGAQCCCSSGLLKSHWCGNVSRPQGCCRNP